MPRDLRFERAAAFARDLVRIRSMSGDEAAAAQRVVQELNLLHFDDVWTDRMGNAMARVKGQGEAPALMLSSHLDVVDSADPDEWEYPPFSGQFADGYLHGRGASDCKGPLALQAYAAASFLAKPPAGDIYLAFTVLEECGSWGMAYVMENLEVRPGAVILGEATDGDICIGQRGRTEVVITLRGKSAHASAPERGCNPVALLPPTLVALERYSGRLAAHSVLGRATLVASGIETWPANRNMVPEEVRIFLDWRTLPSSDASNTEDLRSFLQAQLCSQISPGSLYNVAVQEVVTEQRAYTGLEWKRTISTSPFLMHPEHPLVKAAVQAVHAATGRLPLIRPWKFGTDGSYTCGVYAVPTLGYAPGTEAVAHTNRERLNLAEARTVYAAYPSLIQALFSELADDKRKLNSQKHVFA